MMLVSPIGAMPPWCVWGGTQQLRRVREGDEGAQEGERSRSKGGKEPCVGRQHGVSYGEDERL